MPSNALEPYTFTDFGSLPSGTLFVDARRWSYVLATGQHVPLEDRKFAYDSIVAAMHARQHPVRVEVWGRDFSAMGWKYSPNPNADRMIRFGHWGYPVTGRAVQQYWPHIPVLTGPPLADISEIGGKIADKDLAVILFLHGSKMRRATLDELLQLKGYRSKLGLSGAVRRLEKANLVNSYPGQNTKFVHLTFLGMLRALLENA